jgi:hypothetical protein
MKKLTNSQKSFRILTIGWEPSFIRKLGIPVAQKTDIDFIHGLVGDAKRIKRVEELFLSSRFLPLSKFNSEPLPAPDYELLRSLETPGVPTVKTMIQGDRVLRNRPDEISFGYATLLAKNIRKVIREEKPDVVLATFDNLHSSLSLAVARIENVPWLSMSFSAIPKDLTGFCKGVTPNSMIEIERPVDNYLREEAREIISELRGKNIDVLTYLPARTVSQKTRKIFSYAKNLFVRMRGSSSLGYDIYTWPSMLERLQDIARRTANSVFLPRFRLINTPNKTKFAFFPLHMSPESTVDTWAPFYMNQLALIEQISLALPVDMELVVKLHKSDPNNYSRTQLNNLLKLCRVKLADPYSSSHQFITSSEIVFGIQGTACLEAALLGKPVIVFGDSPYIHFPNSERAEQTHKISAQIVRMLEKSAPEDVEIEEAFAVYMSRFMVGRLNNWRTPIQDFELTRLSECFEALRKFMEVPSNVMNWYE